MLFLVRILFVLALLLFFPLFVVAVGSEDWRAWLLFGLCVLIIIVYIAVDGYFFSDFVGDLPGWINHVVSSIPDFFDRILTVLNCADPVCSCCSCGCDSCH